MKSALNVVLGRFDAGDHGRRRLVSIVQGTLTGLLNKVIGVLISLASVPLTIGYLGAERYGVWALVGSLIAWMRLADLGIGNGLTNGIATAIGSDRPELVCAQVSTAAALFSGIALLLGLLFAAAWPWIDWVALFGLKTEIGRAEVGPAMVAVAVLFLLGFPLSIIGPTFVAFGDGKLSNYWGAAGNVATLLALFVVTRTEGGLVWLVIAVSGTGYLVNLLSGIWLFTRRRVEAAPRISAVRRDAVRSLFRVGVQFLLIQVLAMVVFETDNLVIAHYVGAAHVPPYSLTYTLFSYTSLLQTLVFRYVWAAYTEAIARKDVDWVRRTFAMNTAFSLASTFLAVLPLVFIARPFIRVWAGDAVVPPVDLVMWMAAWSMINALCSPIACLQAAASHMRVQIAYSAVMALANIVLSIYLVQVWGITGVIAGTVISYLLFVCIPAPVDAFLLLRKLRHAL